MDIDYKKKYLKYKKKYLELKGSGLFSKPKSDKIKKLEQTLLTSEYEKFSFIIKYITNDNYDEFKLYIRSITKSLKKLYPKDKENHDLIINKILEICYNIFNATYKDNIIEFIKIFLNNIKLLIEYKEFTLDNLVKLYKDSKLTNIYKCINSGKDKTISFDEPCKKCYNITSYPILIPHNEECKIKLKKSNNYS